MLVVGGYFCKKARTNLRCVRWDIWHIRNITCIKPGEPAGRTLDTHSTQCQGLTALRVVVGWNEYVSGKDTIYRLRISTWEDCKTDSDEDMPLLNLNEISVSWLKILHFWKCMRPLIVVLFTRAPEIYIRLHFVPYWLDSWVNIHFWWYSLCLFQFIFPRLNTDLFDVI
jgi:hypothetical protein